MNKQYLLYKEATSVATKAHEGVTRWDGVTPYITHPLAVAAAVNGWEAKTVAVLHDVVEDTEITLEDLSKIFPPHITLALDTLTHRKYESYLTYILRIRCASGLAGALARTVKLADLAHNMSDLDKKKNKQRYQKYEMAQFLLEIDRFPLLGEMEV